MIKTCLPVHEPCRIVPSSQDLNTNARRRTAAPATVKHRPSGEPFGELDRQLKGTFGRSGGARSLVQMKGDCCTCLPRLDSARAVAITANRWLPARRARDLLPLPRVRLPDQARFCSKSHSRAERIGRALPCAMTACTRKTVPIRKRPVCLIGRRIPCAMLSLRDRFRKKWPQIDAGIRLADISHLGRAWDRCPS